MRIAIVIENKKFYNAIKYTFQILFESFDVNLDFQKTDSAPIVISYGKNKLQMKNQIYLHFVESNFWNSGFFLHSSLPSVPLQKVEDIPVLFTSKGDLIRALDCGLEIRLDLIASSFLLVSRYEEFVLSERDEIGRFQAENSLAYQNNFIQMPLIDKYSQFIEKWLRSLGIKLIRKKYFSNHDFAICLSHDIDTVSNGWLEAINHEIQNFYSVPVFAKELKDILRTRFRKSDLYWNFDQIMQLEEKYGARSTFFMLKKTGNKKDAAYNYRAKRFPKVFEKMIKGGWEIGLHGSLSSLLEKNSLVNEKIELETATRHRVRGVRQHFLRFDVRDAWKRQVVAGFEYDTTLGYVEMPGFRASIARPFRPFDLEKMSAYNCMEIPLVIMDGTFRQYLKMPVESVWEKIQPILNEIKKHHGAAAVLWHNTYFSDYKFQGYKNIYEEILKWVQKNDGALLPCSKVSKKWQAQAELII